MPRRKHYVVFLGRAPGIYGSWAECHRQVIGFSRNSYQSYPTREEAEEAFEAFRRAQGDTCITGDQVEAELGNVSGAFGGQMDEGSTSDDKLKEAANLALLMGCTVLVAAVLLKSLS